MARGYQGESKSDKGFSAHERYVKTHKKEIDARVIKVLTLKEQLELEEKEMIEKIKRLNEEKKKKKETPRFTPLAKGFYKGEVGKVDEKDIKPWHTLTGKM